MNVFQLRDGVVDEYRQYMQSFLQITDPNIFEFVDTKLREGRYWPDPLLQLNPAFLSGGSVVELAENEDLHAKCSQIFRRGKSESSDGEPLTFHKHQTEAFTVAKTGASYVLTTGTGSGKSLAYFVPIIDRILKTGPKSGKVRAIVVYPMNALANSQAEELEKYLVDGFGKGNEPVTFAKYTGDVKGDEREQIKANPPDIILTNYMMLELLLTRISELNDCDIDIRQVAQGLEFLVLDELHTYRGRQGADVSMLVRRVRQALNAPNVQCIGTSATMVSTGSWSDQQLAVAQVASTIFGSPVDPANVIGETLQEMTRPGVSVAELRGALSGDPFLIERLGAVEFLDHPVPRWIEHNIGLVWQEEDSNRRLVRRTPVTLSQAAIQLSDASGISHEICTHWLKSALLRGYQLEHPSTGRKVFAFRLHQFISRGSTVYSTLEPSDKAFLTLDYQDIAPTSDQDAQKRLYPLAFCRDCGQPYFVVDVSDGLLDIRDLRDIASAGNDRQPGYLLLDQDEIYDVHPDPDVFPDSWLDERKDGSPQFSRSVRKHLPSINYVLPGGSIQSDYHPEGTRALFFPGPFRFCMACKVEYDRASEFTKLAELASEGRSTATTVLTLSIVRQLRESMDLDASARKLLSFSDNRQDASLQAGHFNDFVETSVLRAALHSAVTSAGPDGIGSNDIATRVRDHLGFTSPDDYAAQKGLKDYGAGKQKQALTDVIHHRIYRDLRRGWRVNAPNLEQTGQVQVAYESLDEVCGDDVVWEQNTFLRNASPAERRKLASAFLDFLRRELIIDTPFLEWEKLSSISNASINDLEDQWRLLAEDVKNYSKSAAIGARIETTAKERDTVRTITPRSLVGKWVRRQSNWSNVSSNTRLSEEQTLDVLDALVEGLRVAGILTVEAGTKDDLVRFRIAATSLRWIPGDGKPSMDPFRTRRRLGEKDERQVNAFFTKLYAELASQFKGMEAREHTAQVPGLIREEREVEFRAGTLPILFCSPTMELGVDIADLNAVNMRNVPPTPANYAQRSGRAGRNGQPAFVITYCTSMSPHDQYYFKHREKMVAGAVSAPRLDLANETLVQAHMQAVWLAATGKSLGRSLANDVLNLDPHAGLTLQPSVQEALANPYSIKRAKEACRELAQHLQPNLSNTSWFSTEWVDGIVDHAAEEFDKACNRWRDLYRAALNQREIKGKEMIDQSLPKDARQAAERLRNEAEAQIKLLTDTSSFESDFYTYRYFASEGFLPGYNFPRLPLNAYIPGSRGSQAGSKRSESDYVSRGRFLAISEFGPRNIIYYEGNRYRIDRILTSPRAQDDKLAVETIKICNECGAFATLDDLNREFCRQCGARLDGQAEHINTLFRMQNVATRRLSRITSDEEDRLKLGYETRIAYQSVRQPQIADLIDSDGENIGRLEYMPAATIRRINLGWNRRKDKETKGFLINHVTGEWAKQEQEPDYDESDQARDNQPQRVVPFVEDRRNIMVLTLEDDKIDRLSLLHALARGIETVYQLEPRELDLELVGNKSAFRLLFTEASEGGAGVLSRLVSDPDALATVAQEALQICHFSENGADLSGPEQSERCVKACYDCLLSYYNQPSHKLIDRHQIKGVLLTLASGKTQPYVGGSNPEQHRDKLLADCQSELERRFVRMLFDGGFRLPEKAQYPMPNFSTVPDFAYPDQYTVIFVDGPPHDPADVRAADKALDVKLRGGGVTPIRFNYKEEAGWPEILTKHPSVFGKGGAS